MNEPSTLLVVAMGMITVFVVLICLILIIKLLGAIMVKVNAKNAPAEAIAVIGAAPVASAAPAQGDKQKLVAAIAAAIAEEMGTDVNHIKIHSIRKL